MQASSVKQRKQQPINEAIFIKIFFIPLLVSPSWLVAASAAWHLHVNASLTLESLAFQKMCSAMIIINSLISKFCILFL